MSNRIVRTNSESFSKGKKGLCNGLSFLLVGITLFSSLALDAAPEKRRSSNTIYWTTASDYAHKEMEEIAVSYLLQMDHKSA